MSQSEQHLANVAKQYGTSLEALRTVLQKMSTAIGSDSVYIFLTPSNKDKESTNADLAKKTRSLIAFITPDSALAFAQINRTGKESPPRLRQLTCLQIIQAVLNNPKIEALFIVQETDEIFKPGLMPYGLRYERRYLYQLLQLPADAAM